MVVDVSYVCHIWPELFDHGPNAPASIARVDCVSRQLRLMPRSVLVFEVDMWNKMVIEGRGLASRIGHGKKRHLVAMGAHQFHQFEQVNLGAAESKVIFVAIQDPHHETSDLVGRSAG